MCKRTFSLNILCNSDERISSSKLLGKIPGDPPSQNATALDGEGENTS